MNYEHRGSITHEPKQIKFSINLRTGSLDQADDLPPIINL